MHREIIVDQEIQGILDEIRELYQQNSRIALYKLINNTHPAVMSDVFRHLTETERKDIFLYIQRMKGMKYFLPELDDNIIEELFESQSPRDSAKLLHDMPAEDIVDILDLLPESLSHDIQAYLDHEEREEVKEIFQYPEESAGRIMSTQFVACPENLTIKEVISRFQEIDEDADAPYYIYIINDQNKMVGVLSLRQILLYPQKTILSSVMRRDYIAVSPETDQEEVAGIVSQYNYLAVPVIGSDGELVGVVTVEDVLDIIREEASEDILIMAGAGDDREILHRSVFENVRARFPWLLASWLGGIVVLTVIGAFGSLLEKTVILAGFIPIILGMGGNVGTQTTTIIVRGIATDRINLNEVSRVIFKEIRVGMLLGIVYGIFLGLLAFFMYPGFSSPLRLGVVVGLAIFCAMTIASTIGSILPIVLHKLNIDPAIATGPFVTTSVDMMGVLTYFSIASLLLHI
ncbi:MAG: magnesium transporter [Candidatus Marinimicrobia bacterium]|nr:magnesium transporter [Candidatus Neomarinimicrobiota bacterium]